MGNGPGALVHVNALIDVTLRRDFLIASALEMMWSL